MSGRFPASELRKPKKKVWINPYENFLLGFPRADSSRKVRMCKYPLCSCLGTRSFRQSCLGCYRVKDLFLECPSSIHKPSRLAVSRGIQNEVLGGFHKWKQELSWCIVALCHLCLWQSWQSRASLMFISNTHNMTQTLYFLLLTVWACR